MDGSGGDAGLLSQVMDSRAGGAGVGAQVVTQVSWRSGRLQRALQADREGKLCLLRSGGRNDRSSGTRQTGP
jgi:hypothetical protein